MAQVVWSVMVDDFNAMETMLQKGWYHKNLQLGGLNEPVFVQWCTYGPSKWPLLWSQDS